MAIVGSECLLLSVLLPSAVFPGRTIKIDKRAAPRRRAENEERRMRWQKKEKTMGNNQKKKESEEEEERKRKGCPEHKVLPPILIQIQVFG